MLAKRYITIKQSKILYGIAILLMIFHHMFGFPDRIHAEFIVFLHYKTVPVATILAGACRICISIYAFLSGYGMITKLEKSDIKNTIKNGYKESAGHIAKFYGIYWTVFIVFIGYGLMSGSIQFKITEFVKNLIGISCTYNAEWWYVWQYLRMLLVFPLLAVILNCAFLVNSKTLAYIEFLILLIIEVFIAQNNDVLSFQMPMLCFLNGMVISRYSLDSPLSIFNEKQLSGFIVGMILSLSAFCARFTIAGTGTYDFIVGPIFVYGCLLILNFKKLNFASSVLRYIGKYSVYMWLTHTFFIYYYFQKFTFSFKYAILIYIATIFVLVAISFVLDYMKEKLMSCLL